jgi:hypothetical protein
MHAQEEHISNIQKLISIRIFQESDRDYYKNKFILQFPLRSIFNNSYSL